jgi:hypothetical protein
MTPLPINEKDVVSRLILRLKEVGLHFKRDLRLRFGAVDLIAWNKKQILVFEVKYSSGEEGYVGAFHDLLQGLGQLLCYREQVENLAFREDLRGLPIRYILYSNAEIDFDSQYLFLKRFCAKYNVTLWMPLVNHVRISEDKIEIKDMVS